MQGWLISLILLGGSFWTPLLATSFFFEKHARGWHWYEEKKHNEGAREQVQSSLTPTQQIEQQRKDMETKLHTAIVSPTQENITTYLLAQRALMNQSEHFSKAWQRVLMTTPGLDETLIHPTDQNARSLYYAERQKNLETRIRALAGKYGLFFFFKGKCAYCHGFAPVVKRFSQKYGWSVLGISLDGGTISEFPKTKHDNGIASRLGLTHVPALIALHPQTGHIIPLAYGMISESEIERRAERLGQFQEGKANQ